MAMRLQSPGQNLHSVISWYKVEIGWIFWSPTFQYNVVATQWTLFRLCITQFQIVDIIIHRVQFISANKVY